MKRLMLCIALLSSLNCTAQADSAAIKTLIYNKVSKNIAAYWLDYAIRYKGALRNGFLTYYHFFDEYLPNDTYKLEMNIYKLDWQYPVRGYTVFLINTGDWLTFASEKDYKKTRRIQVDGNINDYPRSNYLVIVNNRQELKFVGGLYFLDNVFGDFKIDDKNPESYLEYLKYRTIDDQLKDIKFYKKKGKNYIFSAYSDKYKANVKLSVSRREDHYIHTLIENKE